MDKLNFKQWLNELAGTGAVYDGTRGTFNWWGAVGDPGGVTIDGDPIKPKKKRKKRGRKK